MAFEHISVLAEEALEGLNVRQGKVYVDGTLGGAGHSLRIAERLHGEGTLICLDQDDWAIDNGHLVLEPYKLNTHIVKTNFRYLDKIIRDLGIAEVDGILLDLGVSSPQLDEAERGFSYNYDTPLDMRMDRTQSLTAYNIVNEWDEKELALILIKYGEEKFSRRIAKQIIQNRQQKPIETTGELAQIIKDSIPAPARRKGPHPAKRSFQALRIAVNDELGALEEVLEKGIEILSAGGRMAIITFHSLEDRIVKKKFQSKMVSCTCPPGFPKCVCELKEEFKLITKKAIEPTDREIEDNPRARSAKLRVLEKL
ncbi:16S rRNA (cytosine(1402)-N(4))-methyltransferase RsmH [Desulfuribacillus alkaliarsenatis]|uniref:Ribosomal RNA small subunit methyltransferase H n=1 Tax=Desulfuribacillus alkaliarsenatis TaxID=766136 RepID=A0A1E5FZS3_9FIRM|nr:16S rRNA (cytosine(1402)-N(4))-methyltransferase RsmH [Desulfuribacillus alkaliarsenatis]OEF96081.1 16S rRNA (cytosine(1402)-N(4))-methyltransferase [Desulfuribacillus alkaliarsenatis]